MYTVKFENNDLIVNNSKNLFALISIFERALVRYTIWDRTGKTEIPAESLGWKGHHFPMWGERCS